MIYGTDLKQGLLQDLGGSKVSEQKGSLPDFELLSKAHPGAHFGGPDPTGSRNWNMDLGCFRLLFSILLWFGIRGRSYSNFLAPTVLGVAMGLASVRFHNSGVHFAVLFFMSCGSWCIHGPSRLRLTISLTMMARGTWSPSTSPTARRICLGLQSTLKPAPMPRRRFRLSPKGSSRLEILQIEAVDTEGMDENTKETVLQELLKMF